MQTNVTIDFVVPIVDNFGDLGFALELALALTREDPYIRICIWSESEDLIRRMLPDIPASIDYRDLREFEMSRIKSIVCTFFGYKISGKIIHSVKVLQFDYLQFGGVAGSPSSQIIKSFHGTQYTDGLVECTHFVPSIGRTGGGIVKRKYSELSWELIDTISSAQTATVFVYPPTFEIIKPVILKHTEWKFLILGQNMGDEMLYEQNLVYVPFLPITKFRSLYEACKLNIVRGENTLVTALMTDRVFLWDIYRESNGAHEGKMQDLIEYLGPTHSYLGEFINNPAGTLGQILSTQLILRTPPTDIPDFTKQVLEWINKPL